MLFLKGSEGVGELPVVDFVRLRIEAQSLAQGRHAGVMHVRLGEFEHGPARDMNLTGNLATAQLRELGFERLVLRMRRVEVSERGGDVRGVGELGQDVSRIHGLRRIGDVGRGA